MAYVQAICRFEKNRYQELRRKYEKADWVGKSLHVEDASHYGYSRRGPWGWKTGWVIRTTWSDKSTSDGVVIAISEQHQAVVDYSGYYQIFDTGDDKQSHEVIKGAQAPVEQDSQHP